jgi:hypothetical protein
VLRTCIRKRTVFNKLYWKKLDVHIQKNETRPLSLINYNKNLKVDEDLNVRSEILKLLEHMREMLQHIGIGKDFLDKTLMFPTGNKSKNKQMRFHQTKKLPRKQVAKLKDNQ